MIPHPAPADISLDDVLQALADPQRREIYGQIATSDGIICSDVAPQLPRSTVSVHLKRLREAGLIAQERQGQLVANRPREDAALARFPDLLHAIRTYHKAARRT